MLVWRRNTVRTFRLSNQRRPLRIAIPGLAARASGASSRLSHDASQFRLVTIGFLLENDSQVEWTREND
jgi:hypothetical protein